MAAASNFRTRRSERASFVICDAHEHSGVQTRRHLMRALLEIRDQAAA